MSAPVTAAHADPALAEIRAGLERYRQLYSVGFLLVFTPDEVATHPWNEEFENPTPGRG